MTQTGTDGAVLPGTVAPQFTLVAFHAHPDDESTLSGGTLARAAAEGHRVVVVVATLGEAGLTGNAGDELGGRRLGELERATAALGGSRVVWLGFADSGRDGRAPAPDAFVRADVDVAAERLAAVLREERADVLTVYDPAGGYGHPDHVKLHAVGLRAAALAVTPVVLEATVDRRALLRLVRWLRLVPGLPPEFRARGLDHAFSAPERLTHRVDVRSQLARKRAAMAAHASQRTGGRTPRSIDVYLRLPAPVFRWAFGREWYVEVGRQPGPRLLDDVFASLRERSS